MSNEIIFFTVFIICIIAILMFDLLIVGRGSHEVSFKEAAIWSCVWISLALLFSLFLRYFADIIHGIDNFEELKVIASRYNPELELDPGSFKKSLDMYGKVASINFLSGYLIEESLSVDNLFIIMAILSAFSVRKMDYKRVLFWGILGAIVMRCVFIFAGAALIYRFSWLLYVFGAYLFYAGVKMYLDRNKDVQIEPEHHPVVKFLSRWFNVLPTYEQGKFFVKKNGKIFLTPLLVVVIIIEFTDLIFALDSIPAIFAISHDPYIVFFSNIFAILGLRSLFFLLIKIVEKFYLLKAGVSILLVYVGGKLIFHHWLDDIGFKSVYSLYVILIVLTGSILLSLVFPKKNAL